MARQTRRTPTPADNSKQHTENIFRDFLEAAPASIVVADRDGKIVLINSQTERLFGYRRDELIGHAVEILVPERFRARHPAHRANDFADPRSTPNDVALARFVDDPIARLSSHSSGAPST